MKKAAIVILGIFLVIALTACSQQPENQQDTGDPQDDGQKGDQQETGQTTNDSADVEEAVEDQLITDDVEIGEMI